MDKKCRLLVCKQGLNYKDEIPVLYRFFPNRDFLTIPGANYCISADDLHVDKE